MKIHRSVVVAAGIVLGCSDPGSNGTPPSGSLVVGFDVTGASNSTCNLAVQNTGVDGSAGTAQFFIGAPSPPVANTTLSSRAPAKTCVGVTGANPVSVSGPPNVTATATRSSTGMCFQTGDLRETIGYSSAATDCPVTLTLTCEGVIMYDHIPWSICR